MTPLPTESFVVDDRDGALRERSLDGNELGFAGAPRFASILFSRDNGVVESASIPLAEVIRALRVQLIRAVQEAESEDVRFALGPTEVELQVEITRDGSEYGEIDFFVLSGAENGSRSASRGHTLRVSLTPIVAGETPGGIPLVVGSDRVERPR